MREPFFATYGWHWWVNFANFEGIFYDGRPEALFALLVGRKEGKTRKHARALQREKKNRMPLSSLHIDPQHLLARIYGRKCIFKLRTIKMHIIYLIYISYRENSTFEGNEVKELTSGMNVKANYLLGQCIIKVYPYNLRCDHERTKLKNDFFIK